MKASEVRGVIRTALDHRVKKLGYSDWDNYINALGIQDESLSEVVMLLKDMVEPYIKDRRIQL